MWKGSEAVFYSKRVLLSWAPVCMEQAGCLISAVQLILGQVEKRCNCHICINLNISFLIHVLISFAISSKIIFWGLFVVDLFYLLSDKNGIQQNANESEQMGCRNILYTSQMEIEIFILFFFFEENYKTFHCASDIVFHILSSHTF